MSSQSTASSSWTAAGGNTDVGSPVFSSMPGMNRCNGGDRYELLTKGVPTTQSAHIKVEDFSRDHQREELFGGSRDGRAHGLPDLHGHVGDAADHVVGLLLVLLGDGHIVESRRLAKLEAI